MRIFALVTINKSELMLNLTNSEKQPITEGALDMDAVANGCQESLAFTIVCDERCAVVRNLGALVKWWDRHHVFTFVDRDSTSQRAKELIDDLNRSKWSLFLIDDMNDRWEGPEAVPMILKNLPFGKLAAVLYILPGTMWLTRMFYNVVSHSRRHFSMPRSAGPQESTI